MLRNLTICVAAAALLAAGCATNIPEVPALSDSGSWIPGKVVWHDLVTPDLAGAKSFYGGLFDWSFEDASDEYTVAKKNGQPVCGLAQLRSSDYASYWLPLVSVRDVDSVVDATRAVGGERVVRSFEVPGRGTVGVLRDPLGAAFGVVRTVQGDPVDRVPAAGFWMWDEIWTENVDSATAFYEDTLGYTIEHKTAQGKSHTLLMASDRPRVGVVKKSDPEIPNLWVGYVRVDDLDTILSEATSLGGTVLMAPTAEVRNGTVAIIADPHGAGFVVEEVSQ
jgi:predicted enzyme related to lactoylglutathione lyase